jgi:hypothetical protein
MAILFWFWNEVLHLNTLLVPGLEENKTSIGIKWIPDWNNPATTTEIAVTKRPRLGNDR